MHMIRNFLGKGGATKSDEYSEMVQRGGGVIFNPKIYIADFGNFKQGYFSMKLIQKGNFWVQGSLEKIVSSIDRKSISHFIQ